MEEDQGLALLSLRMDRCGPSPRGVGRIEDCKQETNMIRSELTLEADGMKMLLPLLVAPGSLLPFTQAQGRWNDALPSKMGHTEPVMPSPSRAPLLLRACLLCSALPFRLPSALSWRPPWVWATQGSRPHSGVQA